MPSREAAQLGVSGLGSHVAAKRAGAERREADFCRRDCGMASEKNHSRERDEGRRRGKGMCAP
jgi:hypothetical protein